MLVGRQRAALWGAFLLGTLVASALQYRDPSIPLARSAGDVDPRMAAAENPQFAEAGPLGQGVTAAANRHGLDPALVQAVIEAESGHDAGAVSSRGAQGLMQVLPETAAWLGYPESADPATNLEAGCQYLRALLDSLGGDVELALAAYNAGPGAVRRWGRVPPYRETRAFVARVAANYRRFTGVELGEAFPAGGGG